MYCPYHRKCYDIYCLDCAEEELHVEKCEVDKISRVIDSIHYINQYEYNPEKSKAILVFTKINKKRV